MLPRTSSDSRSWGLDVGIRTPNALDSDRVIPHSYACSLAVWRAVLEDGQVREVDDKRLTIPSQDNQAAATGPGPGKRTLSGALPAPGAPVQQKADAAASSMMPRAPLPAIHDLFGAVQLKASGSPPVQRQPETGAQATPAAQPPAAQTPAVPATPAPQAAPQPTTVANQITDGPYGWQSKFEVTQSGTEYRVVIKPKLVPDAGVTAAQVTDVKTRARAAFTRLFDNKFTLTDTVSHVQYALRADVQFVDSGEHYAVALHSGPDGSSNLANWYTGNYDETLAHELGHQLGLKDEYIDASAPDRATAASPGVHTDHSIMGNYLAEGRPQAAAQIRHGQTIGNEIGGAVGRTFTIARRQ